MSAFARWRRQLKSFNNPFARNMGWLGTSRLINRFTRLAATVVLARSLSPHDYGLAAIVMTTNEFIRVFMRNGINTRLIQVEAERLPQLAEAAYWLNWVIFIGLFLVQATAAFPIAWFYNDTKIILPICCMAATLLMLPVAMVQNGLIQREGRMKILAMSDTLQVTTENVSSLIFAFMGFGMWSIVLPRLIVPPIWVAVMLKNHPWRPKLRFTMTGWGELLRFGQNVLGVELLNTLRSNLDYLLVGRFLGVDALGVYFFAFNAGLGISLGLIQSVKVALLPQLCQARDNLQQFRQTYYKSLRTIAWIFVPVVVVQSALAPFYVPVVFGDKWIPAIPILVLVCLSAIPRPFADAASQLLIAVGRPQIDLIWNVLFTGIFALGLLIGMPSASLGVATSVFVTHSVFLPLFTIWATRLVFRRLSSAQSSTPGLAPELP